MALTSEISHDAAIDAPADANMLEAFARHIFGRAVTLGDVRPTVADLRAYLDLGRYFQEPKLYGYGRGKPRSCWSNAYRIADINFDVRYVQGWVSIQRYATVFPHAWCTDQQNRLIEPTWNCDDARGDEVYFGIAFDRFTLAAIKIADPVHAWHDGFAAVLQREVQRASRPLTPRSSNPEGRSR